jgi:hypothetical protein
MNTFLVPLHRVDEIWPLIAERIVAAVERFNFDCSAGQLWEMCRARGAFLIVSENEGQIKGASIWRFETWLKGPVFRNLITSGDDMASWLPDMRELAESIARQGGAAHYVWDGRPGWKRVFPDAEMTKSSYIMKV